MVINHVSRNVQLNNTNLRTLVDHLHEIIGLFVQIEFSHIFKELKRTTDKFYKEGTMLPEQIIVQEFDDGKTLIHNQFMLW